MAQKKLGDGGDLLSDGVKKVQNWSGWEVEWSGWEVEWRPEIGNPKV